MRFEKGQENLGNHLSPIEESLTELVWQQVGWKSLSSQNNSISYICFNKG